MCHDEKFFPFKLNGATTPEMLGFRCSGAERDNGESGVCASDSKTKVSLLRRVFALQTLAVETDAIFGRDKGIFGGREAALITAASATSLLIVPWKFFFFPHPPQVCSCCGPGGQINNRIFTTFIQNVFFFFWESDENCRLLLFLVFFPSSVSSHILCYFESSCVVAA